MFKLVQKETYTWPVKVDLPVDGGKREAHTFDVEFRRLAQSRILELQAGGTTDPGFVREAVVGWKGVGDAAGEPLPFSAQALDQLIDMPGVASAIVTAFFDSIVGARTKN